MPAGHMTEEEYAAFKKQTGHKEGQTVKTYYAENKKEAEGLKHHAERVEKNRKLHNQQISTTERLKRAIGGKGTSDQNIKTNYKPKESQKSEPKKPSGPSNMEKAKGWLKERSVAIAQNTRDIRPRGGSVYGAVGMGLPQNPDLFGVGSFGGGGGLHGMMGADPFHELHPRRNPQPAPQKKRKRKTKRRAPPAQAGGFPPMMGGIPKGMKWMFGQ